MSLADLIKFYRHKLGLNKSQFAQLIGVSRMSVNRWENGDVKSVNEDTLLKLSEALNMEIPLTIDSNLLKPILGSVKAGYDLLAFENIEDYIEVSSSDAKKGDYFLRVVGDSMTGSHIYPGHLVYVKQTSNVQNGDIAIIMIEDEVTIKKIYKKENGVLLEATNPDYEDRFYNHESIQNLPIRIIGKVLYTKVDFS